MGDRVRAVFSEPPGNQAFPWFYAFPLAVALDGDQGNLPRLVFTLLEDRRAILTVFSEDVKRIRFIRIVIQCAVCLPLNHTFFYLEAQVIIVFFIDLSVVQHAFIELLYAGSRAFYRARS